MFGLWQAVSSLSSGEGAKYCSKPECQKERKRRWHNRKMADDPDYRQNQLDVQRRWREAHRDYIEHVRQQNPIVDVVAETVELRRSGKEYSGRCPLHNDPDPSCS